MANANQLNNVQTQILLKIRIQINPFVQLELTFKFMNKNAFCVQMGAQHAKIAMIAINADLNTLSICLQNHAYKFVETPKDFHFNVTTETTMTAMDAVQTVKYSQSTLAMAVAPTVLIYAQNSNQHRST